MQQNIANSLRHELEGLQGNRVQELLSLVQSFLADVEHNPVLKQLAALGLHSVFLERALQILGQLFESSQQHYIFRLERCLAGHRLELQAKAYAQLKESRESHCQSEQSQPSQSRTLAMSAVQAQITVAGGSCEQAKLLSLIASLQAQNQNKKKELSQEIAFLRNQLNQQRSAIWEELALVESNLQLGLNGLQGRSAAALDNLEHKLGHLQRLLASRRSAKSRAKQFRTQRSNQSGEGSAPQRAQYPLIACWQEYQPSAVSGIKMIDSAKLAEERRLSTARLDFSFSQRTEQFESEMRSLRARLEQSQDRLRRQAEVQLVRSQSKRTPFKRGQSSMRKKVRKLD